VYGTLNVNLQRTSAEGATTRADGIHPRNGVSVDSSNIGVKGSLALGSGLSVIGQCETSAAIDGVGTSGICGRNSRVGVASERFGTLFYGNWDTPYKTSAVGTKADDPFQNTDVFGYQGIFGSPGFNTRTASSTTAAPAAPDASGPYPSGGVVAGFDVRAGNSVAYASPALHGVTVKLQYSADEFRSKGGDLGPQLFSVGIQYEWKGLSVLAAWERHDDAFGLAAINVAAASDGTPAAKPAFGATAANDATHTSVDVAWRAGAGYQLDTAAGSTTVGLLVEQLSYEQKRAAVGAVKEYSRLAWQVAAKHRYGDHELRVRYDAADAGDVELVGGGAASTSGYGATQLAAGYAYDLSKTAQAYLSYTRIVNEKKAQYTLGVAGVAAVAGSTPKGADPQALGLGLRYSF
jgi:predicted porin